MTIYFLVKDGEPLFDKAYQQMFTTDNLAKAKFECKYQRLRNRNKGHFIRIAELAIDKIIIFEEDNEYMGE